MLLVSLGNFRRIDNFLFNDDNISLVSSSFPLLFLLVGEAAADVASAGLVLSAFAMVVN